VIDGTGERAFTADEWAYSRSRNSISFLAYVPRELATVRIRYREVAAE
jgi:hypothetical protein